LIEREQNRADAQGPQVSLAGHLKAQHAELVDRIAGAAFERGYSRYVPDLRASIASLVQGISDAIAAYISSENKTAYCPGEDFENDPLAALLRHEALVFRSHGVLAEVLFGLLQQCRVAYLARCLGADSENREVCQALLELCFDRLELSLVSAWTASGRDGQWHGPSDPESHGSPRELEQQAIELQIAHRVAERTKEIAATNEHLRRELDQRMRVEEERELYYRALLHSQKLEAVGSLAGGVAHDLNNLFQVIRFNVDLLRERADSAAFGLLEAINQATERAVGLVRQLLLFSRKQPMSRRVLDVGEVVRDLLRLLRRVMPENVRLFSEVEDKLPLVRADLSAVEQLVVNLIINARDSMPRGGTIHISVGRQRRVPPDRIRAASSMHQIAICVRDVGTGMPQEVLSRIFDPFFTTKNNGSGLGLSVVHGVVEEHGGWLEVTSTLGQGSCFTVYLPALDEAAQSDVATESVGQQGPRGNGEHLLLVEDEEVVRHALGRELTRHGYSVQAVGTGEEALAVYRRAPGHFDCVISDGLMPGMSGPEMVLEMLKDNGQQRAIFISGYAPTMECWKDLQCRGYRLLAKPFSAKELLSAVRETLEKEQESAAVSAREPHWARRDH
jgi:signal transduction histidine kinase/ActR/RegA family two-component response regulator